MMRKGWVKWLKRMMKKKYRERKKKEEFGG
jgi:hypothetical protein